jgi:hypothetical protein
MDARGDFAARYARQILLAEVGSDGQRRIGESVAPVAGVGLCHRVAELYARRAGFAQVGPGAIDIDGLAPADLVEHAGCRAILAGSRAALAAFRGAALVERVGSRGGSAP